MTDVAPTVDLGRLLRALRRRADLSQRELAARAGLAHPVLARIESGVVTNPSFRTVERLVRAAGARLAAGAGGPVPHEELRDAADRHYPAHLDVEEVTSPERWWGAWWTTSMARSHWPMDLVPAVTFDRSRPARDQRRERAARGRLAVVRRAEWSGSEPAGEQRPVDWWIFTADLPDGTRVGELRAHRAEPEEVAHRLWPPGVVVLDGVVMAPLWRRLGIGRRLLHALDRETGGPIVALAAGWSDEQFLQAAGYHVMQGRAACWYGRPAQAGTDSPR